MDTFEFLLAVLCLNISVLILTCALSRFVKVLMIRFVKLHNSPLKRASRAPTQREDGVLHKYQGSCIYPTHWYKTLDPTWEVPFLRPLTPIRLLSKEAQDMSTSISGHLIYFIKIDIHLFKKSCLRQWRGQSELRTALDRSLTESSNNDRRNVRNHSMTISSISSSIFGSSLALSAASRNGSTSANEALSALYNQQVNVSNQYSSFSRLTYLSWKYKANIQYFQMSPPSYEELGIKHLTHQTSIISLDVEETPPPTYFEAMKKIEMMSSRETSNCGRYW